jgi:hypothetical protein
VLARQHLCGGARWHHTAASGGVAAHTGGAKGKKAASRHQRNQRITIVSPRLKEPERKMEHGEQKKKRGFSRLW